MTRMEQLKVKEAMMVKKQNKLKGLKLWVGPEQVRHYQRERETKKGTKDDRNVTKYIT